MLLSNEPCFNNFCFEKDININSRPKAVFYTGGREMICLKNVRLGQVRAAFDCSNLLSVNAIPIKKPPLWGGFLIAKERLKVV